MIEQLKDLPVPIVGFVCTGQVTRHDYRTVLEPVVEQALGQHDKLRLYYQIDPGFSGFEPGAVWEDAKVGAAHLLRWERIAVVTDIDWIRHAVGAFSFVMPGMVRVFSLDQQAAARAWITAPAAR